MVSIIVSTGTVRYPLQDISDTVESRFMNGVVSVAYTHIQWSKIHVGQRSTCLGWMALDLNVSGFTRQSAKI